MTPAQKKVYDRMEEGREYSSYSIGCPISTLRAMARKGYVRDVTKPGPGGMFSPQTHFKYIKIGEAK